MSKDLGMEELVVGLENLKDLGIPHQEFRKQCQMGGKGEHR